MWRRYGSFFDDPQHILRGLKGTNGETIDQFGGEFVVVPGQGISDNILGSRNVDNVQVSVSFQEDVHGGDEG